MYNIKMIICANENMKGSRGKPELSQVGRDKMQPEKSLRVYSIINIKLFFA